MRKGFTLLELLIGITIFAIISGAVYSSLYLGIKVWKHEESRNENMQEAMLTFAVLEKCLRSTFMNPDNDSIRFSGSAERVDFFCVNKNGQLENVSFYVEPGKDVDLFSLLLSRKKYRQIVMADEASEENSPDIEVVNTNITDFKLAYFNSLEKKWYDNWPEELTAPQQVKAEIDFAQQYNTNNGSSIHLVKYINIPVTTEINFVSLESLN